MNNIALVTGITGFIGSHLAKRLVSEGWQVHGIVRPNSALESLGNTIESIHTHVYDGTVETLSNIVREVQPTIVIHLASLFLAQHTPKDIDPMIQSNILFPCQLVEAMVEHKVFSLINTGTSWQHFENSAYSPVCLYAATKQAFETVLQFYLETSPLKVITLKLFDSYGQDDRRKKLFALLEKLSVESESLAMSPGEQKINLVYIEDIIDAYLIAIERLKSCLPGTHESYAIASEELLSLREIISIYEDELGQKLPISWGGRSYRSREVMEPWSSGLKLEGWQAKINLREGIKRVRKKQGNQDS